MTRLAAKYKRISRDREGLALGIERQDQDLDDLADRRGLDIVGDYFDNDISASTGSSKARPDYRQMIADARAGKFQVIIAYTTGRLTRRPREFEDLIDLSVEYGIEFEYVRSPSFDLNTAQGRRIARTLAAQDAGEAEEIAERVTRQKLQAAADGQWRGGRRPYGYDLDGVTVIPAEAAEVLRASEAVLAGSSLRSIAADLNARGLVTSTGRPWRSDTIGPLLLRARNAGLIEHNGEIIGPAKWPAIVPEPIWRAVHRVLTDPGRRTQLTSVRRWLGTNLYRCGVCGEGVRAHVSSRHSRGRGKVHYTCRAKKCVARTCADVDAVIERAVIKRLAVDGARLLARDASRDTSDMHTEALALRQRLDSLAAMFGEGAIDARQLREGSERLRRQLDQVEAEITDAGRGSVLSGLVGAGDVAAVWEALHLDRQRAIVSALMTVTLKPTRRGRPPGWRPGQSYFDPTSVQIEWKV